MSKKDIIEAEAVTTEIDENVIDLETVDMGELVRLEQSPVLMYERMAEIGEAIQLEIEKLDIENMVATPENSAVIKDKRANLNRIYQEADEARLNVYRAVKADYENELLPLFNKEIKERVLPALEAMDTKIKAIDAERLQVRIDKFSEMFETHKNELQEKLDIELDFISLENVDTKINLSNSDKNITTAIETFFKKLESDIELIFGQPESDNRQFRMLEMYKKDFDVNTAILKTNEQIKIEKEQAHEAEMRARKREVEAQERKEREAKEAAEQAKLAKEKEAMQKAHQEAEAKAAQERQAEAEAEAEAIRQVEAKEAADAAERAAQAEAEAKTKAEAEAEAKRAMKHTRFKVSADSVEKLQYLAQWLNKNGYEFVNITTDDMKPEALKAGK